MPLARGEQWQLYAEGKGSDELRLQDLANTALEADLRWRHMNWIFTRLVSPDRRPGADPNHLSILRNRASSAAIVRVRSCESSRCQTRMAER